MELTSRSNFTQLIKQILAYAPALLIPGLVNFFALSLYTHLLSPEDYGHYAYVLALVVMVKMVGFEWVRLGVFRFFQKALHEDKLKTLLSTAITGFAIISVLVIFFWLVLQNVIPIPEELKAPLKLGLPLLIIWAIFELILQIHRSAITPVRYGSLALSRAILSLLFSVGLITVLKKGEIGLIIGIILGTVIPLVVDLIRWPYPVDLRSVDRMQANLLFRYSFPFVLIFLLDFIISISNRFLLQHFSGAESVGLYSVSYDLANQTLMMLFTLLNFGTYPLIIKTLEQEGKEASRSQLRQYSTLFFLLALPACFGLASIAQPFADVVLGGSFQHMAGRLIPWVALSTLFLGVRMFYFDLAFQLGMRTNLQIWTVGVGAGLSVVLNLWLIPHYGVIGAVWATCFAYFVSLLISQQLGRKVFSMPFEVKEFIRISLATLIMVLSIILESKIVSGWLGLFIMVISGSLVYISVLWILDIGQIRQVTSSIFSRIIHVNG
jgi:O-antigen/teichoic acid export membrane protein